MYVNVRMRRYWRLMALTVGVLIAIPAFAQQSPTQPPPTKDVASDAESAAGQSDAMMSEEALARFQQILQRRPLHNPAFQGLVKYYVDQGRLADLATKYEQRVEALPDDVASRIVLARVYLRAGQAEKAADLVDAIETLPEDLERDESKLLVLKSEVYQRVGRLEPALAMLNRALERARTISERMELSEALADLHLRANKPEQAAAAFVKLAEEYPDNYLHRKRVADELAQRGLHEAAVEQYRAALGLVQDQTDKRCETLRQLGRSLERLERRQDAIDAYTEASNLLASGHWLQRELHERIVSLYRAADRLDALVDYCRAQIERQPEQTSMRGLLADVLAARGEVDAAKEVLAEAIQLFPKDRALSEKRVEFLERVQDAEGVAAEYERIITQYPDDFELYINYGRFLADNRQLEAARRQWKHVLGSELTDVSLANRLGELFDTYELYDDAVECYERAIELDPKRPEAYTALSRLWFFRGERDKALAALHRMAEANPEDAETHASLCQALLALGQTDGALQAITRACELDPKQVRHQLMRAGLLVTAGQLDEALAVRRATIDMMDNPMQRAQAIQVLVSIYASASRLDELQAAETKRLETEPDSAVCLLLLARAADLQRDFPAARGWLQRLLEVDPAHEEGRRQLARLYEAVGDVDAAVEQYRRLIESHPARARQYYQSIADAKLRYQDKAGAIETFERMVQADPDNATVLKEVAEQIARLGELERAIGYYEQSLRIQPDRHEVRLAYANALQEAGRLPEALEALKTTALQKQDRDSAADALAKLHDVADQLGTLDELLQELQSRVEADPDETLVARTLAHLLIREYEYTRASDMLELVLRHHPRDAELQLVKAELLRRLAKFDDALETYRFALRIPQVDRDFVLGEMGKAYFESGQLEQARRLWRQIGHKLYAGTLLRNNGLVEDALSVLQEGIRLKPDDYGLHRNLIHTLELAGRTDEALAASRRLLDLEPDNVFNITGLAKAYLEHGDRAAAAEVAGRLFSADVAEKQSGQSQTAFGGSRGMPLWALSMQSAWGYGSRATRNNLDRGVEFFRENGLLRELEDILTAQLEAQPDNVILRLTAISLFSEEFGKPEVSLRLMRELETGEFPLEHQAWLGQSTQRDHFRVHQYQLIASKPALRDQRLAELEPKPADELSRDETLELAVIRQAQGVTDQAIDLLQRAVKAAPDDVVALSALVDTLTRAERFTDAEPHTKHLCDLLAAERERTREEMIERVRRDFVRSLPLRFQLRVTDQLLRDIAHKWTLGQSFVSDFTGFVQTMGYFRARLTLATIYAKTDHVELAREIWQELRPTSPADVDGWTMLAGVAQMYDQQDLAFDYYQQALRSARVLVADPLLQRVYGGSLSQVWFDSEERIDSSFNKIVEAFSAHDKLIELYDFLRETDQGGKARRVAEQYELYDQLKTLFSERFEQAGEEFRHTTDEPLHASVPYFMQACKLAELYDVTGDWPAALKVYEQYLADFPDELGLLVTLGEVAERQSDFADAIAWEKKVVAAKERLARQARDWALREIYMTPAVPQVLGGDDAAMWSWGQRWGKYSWWGYGSTAGAEFDRTASWMRIAQLYLAQDNTIAAADALERAIGLAATNREEVARQILNLIRQWQLTDSMLSVLRSLAVYLPTNEQAQLTFAESLEANDRHEVAMEVYRRMLRRGVSDLSVLAKVRRRMGTTGDAASEEAPATLESLAAEVAADPDNASRRLRLAKAYYYSLDVDRALETLRVLEETAPHLEGLHDLLIEIHTIRGDTDALIEALRTKIKRSSDENDRNLARSRLAEELLTAGRTDEALETLKELADPKNPHSYERVGVLLHYFGRHDEALEQFELLGRSQSSGGYGQDESGMRFARAMAINGDFSAAADKILESVDKQIRQTSQYGGIAAMYSFFESETNYFSEVTGLFVLAPELRDEIRDRLVKRHEANRDDPQAAKLLMQFYKYIGRNDLAEAMLENLAGKGVSDQALVTRLIDRAVERREFDKAIEMIERFISQQPKPQLPPGMPPQFAGMMMLMSPRNVMLCKLGDIYWKMDNPERAFEAYKQIIDEDLEETRIAYATICLMRDRVDEARTLVEEALAAQQVKSPNLLQFRALVAALDGDPERMFDSLAKSIELGGAQAMNPYSGDEGVGPGLLVELAQEIGQLDRACDFLRQRIAKNPNNWDNHERLAETYYANGRIEEAFAALDEAAKVKSLTRQALEQRLHWSEGFATREELIPLYEELIELGEKKVKQTSVLGRFFGSSNDQPQTDTEPLRGRLGELLWELGKHEQAETVWTERMDMQSAGCHITMGQRYYERDEYELARKSYEKALELDPENDAAHRALAALTFHTQQRAAALEHLKSIFLNSYDLDSLQQQRDDDYYYRRYNRSRDFAEDLRPWAVEIAADADLLKQLGESGAQDAFEQRLALDRLTGDWKALEASLRERREQSPYDPMVWTLWCELQERTGDWAEAVHAREYLRQLKRTTLPRHREELELVLAGRQIKDAAAGIKEADPNAAATSGRSGYSRGYYGYRGSSVRSEISRLAALHAKLGEYEQAERLYLLSAEYGLADSVLPDLASMMWQQGARDRALELFRLAVIMSDDTDSVPQYAGMLAEAGRVEEATDLLVRAYRSLMTRESADIYSMMYGYYDTDERQQFENYEEEYLAAALHDILKRTGTREAALARLKAEAEREPNDERLAKIILSLEIRDERWDEARESLAARRAARPHDPAIMTQQIRVSLQSRDWPAALQVIRELRAEEPETGDTMRIPEAFARIMQDDRAGAAEVIAPLLASTGSRSDDIEPARLWTVLAVTQNYDVLRETLRSAYDRRALDEAGQALLARVCLIQGDYAAALRLALDALWNDSSALSCDCTAYRTLALAVRQAQAANAPTTPSDERPEDRALLMLLTDGPAAALSAFQELAAAAPDNVNASRGLVLAAAHAGDYDLAISANARLIDWLQAQRRYIWQPAAREPLGERADRFLTHAKSMGLNSASILGMTMAFSNLIEEIVQSNTSQASEPITYEPLWRAHHHLQANLLLQAGRTDDLAALLKQEARLAAATEYGEYGGYSDYNRYSYYRGRYNDYSRYRNRDEAFTRDWRGVLCAKLAEGQRLADLATELERLGPRVPRDNWFTLSECYAAAGRGEAAQTWRHKAAAAKFADLCAVDAPQITSDEGRYSWRWRWYGRMGSDEADRLRGRLHVALPHAYDDPDEPPRSPLHGDPTDIWEFALLDADTEARLVGLADSVKAGWSNTQTVKQLVDYYEAKEQPERILALLDQAVDADDLLRSPQLAEYIRACYETQDWPRIERVLDAAVEWNSVFKNDADLVRLTTLCHQGKQAEADALEQSLIERCRTEPENPHRLDPRLTNISAGRNSYYYANQRYFGGSSRGGWSYGWRPSQSSAENLGNIVTLAQSLGLPYAGEVASDDLTLYRLRLAYANHGFHRRAAHIADIELSRLPSSASDRERADLLENKAALLARAGDADAARQTVTQAEAIWLQEAQVRPADVIPLNRLTALYGSAAFGRDYAKACEAWRTAKLRDPSADAWNLEQAKCLFNQGMYAEAWKQYKCAIEHGGIGNRSDTLYQAGISARESGDAEAAARLLRRALWRDPLHRRADRAREVTHE